MRSNLAKAITNTPGYEAYDRTDMDAILGEQNFQRTGMVSNEQIKRLGEMTGAQYVLVAEAAVIDATNMYITAKLLDVETARTEMTDNQMMGTNAREIQKGCQLLAANLVKPIIAVKVEKSSKISKYGSTSAHHGRTAIPSGNIVKVSRNEYHIGETTMDKHEYEKVIYQNCSDAWKKYKSGKRAIAAGWSLFGIGGACLVAGGAVCAIMYSPISGGYRPGTVVENALDGDPDAVASFSLMMAGAGMVAMSIPILSVGYSKRNNAYKVYNNSCAPASTPLTFSVTAGQNGIGLAMNF